LYFPAKKHVQQATTENLAHYRLVRQMKDLGRPRFRPAVYGGPAGCHHRSL